jgi:cohesin loading factor subunit SCC2
MSYIRCKSRKADSYSLAEYRQILEQTLQDIMAVFNDPDWPVAELIMRVFSRILVSLLDGNHSDQYLKSLAIEWLGIICSKIKTGYNKLSGGYKTYTPEWIYELNESLPIKVDNETPLKSIALLDQCRKQLLNYELEERVNQNVTHFYLCNWGFIESVVWSKANKGWEVEEKKPITKMKKSTKEEESLEDDINQDTTMMDSSSLEEDPKWPKEAALLLGDTCKYYWLACLGVDHPFPRQVPTHFEFPEMSRSDYVLLTELLASRQTLYTSFNFMLTEILTCLDKDAVIYRTKALKAIGKIASEVPEILEDVSIMILNAETILTVFFPRSRNVFEQQLFCVSMTVLLL